jgi:hypothetical protein
MGGEGSVPAGWYPDPRSRADHRYWDGNQWTERVSRAGTTGTDPTDRTWRGPKQRSGRVSRKRWTWICAIILVLGVAATATIRSSQVQDSTGDDCGSLANPKWSRGIDDDCDRALNGQRLSLGAAVLVVVIAGTGFVVVMADGWTARRRARSKQ